MELMSRVMSYSTVNHPDMARLAAQLFTNSLVDARPDYPATSTEARLETAASRALCM